jgi:hypothetical protein
MLMSDQNTEPASDVRHEKRIDVLVNEKPVVLEGRLQTGESVKQAAIHQHVPIQLDFVLSIERGGGRTELVGDDQKIEVHEHERFLAIPNDDNS